MRIKEILLFLLALLSFNAKAGSEWPDYLDAVVIDGEQHDCVFYPYSYDEAAESVLGDCDRFKHLFTSMNLFVNDRSILRISSGGQLSLFKFFKRNVAKNQFEEKEGCYGDGVRLNYTGYALVPLERRCTCSYRVMAFDKGLLVKDKVLPFSEFEAFVRKASIHSTDTDLSMLKTLTFYNWRHWGGDEPEHYENQYIRQGMRGDTLFVYAKSPPDEWAYLDKLTVSDDYKPYVRHLVVKGRIRKLADELVNGFLNLETITIEEAVHIGDLVISNCPALRSVHFGQQIATIDGIPINNCPNVRQITIDNCYRYKVKDNVLYDTEENKELYRVPSPTPAK